MSMICTIDFAGVTSRLLFFSGPRRSGSANKLPRVTQCRGVVIDNSQHALRMTVGSGQDWNYLKIDMEYGSAPFCMAVILCCAGNIGVTCFPFHKAKYGRSFHFE